MWSVSVVLTTSYLGKAPADWHQTSTVKSVNNAKSLLIFNQNFFKSELFHTDERQNSQGQAMAERETEAQENITQNNKHSIAGDYNSKY